MSAGTLTTADPQAPKHAEPNAGLTVADAVWVGMALLHIGRPAQDSFPKQDIVESVINHSLTNADVQSIKQHVNQHCVANCKPQPNRSRMLYATREKSHRRLFKPGIDRYDSAREGSPTHPEWSVLPTEYVHLRDWYEKTWLRQRSSPTVDPLLALIGAGSEIWKDEPADQYVANLRTGWEGRP